MDPNEIDANNLKFYIYPFVEKQFAAVCVPPTNKDPKFGFEFATDYVSNTKYKTCVCQLSSLTLRLLVDRQRMYFNTH